MQTPECLRKILPNDLEVVDRNFILKIARQGLVDSAADRNRWKRKDRLEVRRYIQWLREQA